MMGGNKKAPNAQKWTLEKVSAHLDKVELSMEEEYCFFLGNALKRQGLRKHVWSYWKKIFADNDDIIERMLLIDSRFEVKIVDAALKGVLPRTIALRTLKCVYGWKITGRSKPLTHQYLDEY